MPARWRHSTSCSSSLQASAPSASTAGATPPSRRRCSPGGAGRSVCGWRRSRAERDRSRSRSRRSPSSFPSSGGSRPARRPPNLDPDAPAVILFDRTHGRAAPVGLTPYGSVVAREQERDGGTSVSGVSTPHAPRRRTETIGVEGLRLRLRSAAAALDLEVGSRLAAAVERVLARAAPAACTPPGEREHAFDRPDRGPHRAARPRGGRAAGRRGATAPRDPRRRSPGRPGAAERVDRRSLRAAAGSPAPPDPCLRAYAEASWAVSPRRPGGWRRSPPS